MADAEKTNILVVDDLPEKLLVYQTILEELGQNVVTARSGGEALKLILQQDFAVILLDVQMPDMDGFETAALIRKRRRSAHTPIIFLTSFTDEVRAARGYATGAVDYILAPVVPEILRAKVKVFVDLFRMTEQVRRQAEERVALAEERSRREAAEEANRRLRFLAQAGAVLGQSLDYQVTVRDAARLPVPFLADLAAAVTAEQAGGPWKGALARRDEAGPAVEDFTSPDHLPGPLAAAVGRVLSAGRPELFPGDEPNQATAAVLPLQARGRTFAALVLSAEESGRRLGPAEMTMAEDLAARAAIALENARLYRDVQQADRQKNEFLSMLAHELRNPLAPISNAVHMLRQPRLGPEEVQWARDVIERQVKHLVRLVDDLLDVSRITRDKIRLEREPVEIAGVMNLAVEASRPAIEARQHQLEVEMPSEPLMVNGDWARLTQVLTNLLNNAAKYTEKGGHIWLTAGRANGEVVLRVRDTGIGIPGEMLGAVFDLFTQVDRSIDRSEGGLGIGLTLARRLVEMHGGSIEAHSEGPGRGSEFVIRLPALVTGPTGPPTAEEGSEPARGSNGRGRVLVVDDNADAADSLAILLRLEGYDVHLAHDGPSALEAAGALRPEVVMLDIGLPGMDGYEVARQLRAKDETRDAVLVAITGYGQEEDRSRSAAAGFNHHLVKPVDYGLLQSVLTSSEGVSSQGR